MNGYDLAQIGAQSALKHAGNNWADEAFKSLCHYAASHDTFLTDDVRTFAHSNGLPMPPDNRAWGGVVSKAAHMDLIERVGYAPVKSSSGHARPMSLWKLVSV